MVDVGIIKDLYAKMTDDELFHFAKNELAQLTPASVQLLKAEFNVRHIEAAFFTPVEDSPTVAVQDNQSTFPIIAEDFTEDLWDYALNEKEMGRSDAEINYFLLQKGLSPASASQLMHELSAKAKERMNTYETNIVMYWISFFTAVILFILISNHTLSATAGIYGVMLLIISGVGGLKCYYAKRKYRTILSHIEAGKNDYIETIDIED